MPSLFYCLLTHTEHTALRSANRLERFRVCRVLLFSNISSLPAAPLTLPLLPAGLTALYIIGPLSVRECTGASVRLYICICI